MLFSYLVSVPACHTVLAPVYALLEARTQHYSQVLEVRGKLEMMTKQRSDKSAEHHIDIDKEPLIGKIENLKSQKYFTFLFQFIKTRVQTREMT